MTLSTRQFQKDRFKRVVRLADLRYETNVNVQLPIRSLFHALIKSEVFDTEIVEQAHKLLETAQYIGRGPYYSFAKPEYDLIKRKKALLARHLLQVTQSRPGVKVRRPGLLSKSKEIKDAVYAAIEKLNKAESDGELKLPKDSHTTVKGETNELYQLTHQLYLLESFLDDHDFTAYLKSHFLMMGEAGIGKTHLFCDFAKEAIELGHPTYIFLGEEFSAESNPLKTISRLLGGNSRHQTILPKIDQAAARKNKRAVIMIDAVNEAQVKVDWSKLEGLAHYKNISFAISIRNGYEQAVLKASFRQTVPTFNHYGLDVSDFNDVSKFFSHYKVPLPEVPLIAPEFRNPLFIKIFCRAYANKRTVRGHLGSSKVFEDYVKKQAKQVLQNIGEQPRPEQLWNGVIKAFAEWMGENGSGRILESKAKQIAELKYPGKSKELLQEMQRYWLLTKTPHYTRSGKVSGYEYRFPYQKFSDHLIVRYLLNNNLDVNDPAKSFKAGTKLGSILASSYPNYDMRYGLIEAMAIQVPERLRGKDLVKVAPKGFRNSYIAIETFLNSLMWRSIDRESGNLKCFIREDVVDYINEYVVPSDDGFNKALNAIINVACIEHHPLDAESLHKMLSLHKMPDRDAFWQSFLYDFNEEGSVIERYLTWANSPLSRKMKSLKARELTAIAMAWFLASSNRRVRDKTTKALVNLLDGKYSLLAGLLRRFRSVDDVYIVERLYAVAYGCALRETNPEKIKPLATLVYDTEFATGQPMTHILIRDYARGIVELYHSFDSSAPFDKKKYLPPYSSTFPKRAPTEASLERKYKHSDDIKKSYSSLNSSVLSPLGDFGNYVIDSNLSRFTKKRLDGTTPKSDKDFLNAILAKLSNTQLKAVEEARAAFQIVRLSIIRPGKTEDKKKKAEAEEKLEALLASLGNLSKKSTNLIEKYVRGEWVDDQSLFDTKLARRWIFNRVIELGWNPKKHGTFDRSIAQYDRGRSANKPERIGKKYQWQALHEFLARTADNFVMTKDEGNYEGPWQLHIRDIDPSYTIAATSAADKGGWWFKLPYDNWHTELSDVDWMRNEDDLPDFKNLIKTRHRSKDWVNLESFFHWKQPLLHIPENKRYNYKHRELWVMIKSYIIKKEDLQKFTEWGKTQHFMGRWMPESHEFYTAFYREFPIQRAFAHMYTPYYGKQDWYTKDDYHGEKLPCEVMVTDDEYMQEGSGYDLSIDEGFGIKLPAKPIYEEMDVRSARSEGQYKNEQGQIVFLDPSVKEKGPQALLSSLTHFTTFLESKGYALVWTVLGEKQSLGGSMGRDPNWPGRFEYSGVYHLDTATGDIVGDVYTKKFVTREQ